MPIHRTHELIEAIIDGHAEHMGDQHLPYNNHVYRAFNFALMFCEPSEDDIEKLEIGSAFHDLGMWPDKRSITKPLRSHWRWTTSSEHSETTGRMR